MTASTDADPETTAAGADALAAKIRSWKAGTPAPTSTPTPTLLVDPRLWQLVVDEQFSAAKLDKNLWWDPYDNADGTGGVGKRKGSLATLRSGQLIGAAERPSATNTDYEQWFSTGVAMRPKKRTFGRWEFEASVSNEPGL